MLLAAALTQRPELPLALLLTAVVALAAWRAGSLSLSGAMAALCVGTAALTASWGFGAYLITWFVLASVLSRLGRSRKAARVRGIVEKGDRRDAWQVLANGGVFAIAAAATTVLPDGKPTFSVIAAATLAAAGADTWSTEIGTLLGGTPWSLRLWRPVQPGTSGAVTAWGSAGGAAGAAILGSMAVALHLIPFVQLPAVIAGALAGAWTDTLIGAWLQSRRWCGACQMETEQGVHDCGTRTDARGGITPLDNDAVNLLCTVIGATVAVVLSP